MSEEFRPSRRIVFHGLGALGVAAVLAGCGGGGEPSGGGATGDATTGGATTGGSGSPEGTGGEVLAQTSDVPVGGGVIDPDRKIVVTQPSEGEFKAYSAICKHQGLTVTDVQGGEIICAHHGSRYAIESGEVTSPPAPAPLDEVAIKVAGDQILAA